MFILLLAVVLQSKASCDFLEELKCLFLHVRNPPKCALEELVQQIIKCKLNSVEGLEWLRSEIDNLGISGINFLME